MSRLSSFSQLFDAITEPLSLRKSFFAHLAVAVVCATALSLGTLFVLSRAEQWIYDSSYGPTANFLYDETTGDFVSSEVMNISVEEGRYIPVCLARESGKRVPADNLRERYGQDFLVYGEIFTLWDSEEIEDPAPGPLVFDSWGKPLPPSSDMYCVSDAMDAFQQAMWEQFVQLLSDAPDSNAARSYRAALGKLPATSFEARELFEEAYGTVLAMPFDYFSTTMYTQRDLDLLQDLENGAYLLIVAWFIVSFLVAGNQFYRSRLARPLCRLEEASERIGQQDLDFDVIYDRHDEMGQLAASFETMRASLEASQRQLWQVAEDQRQLNAAFAHDLRTPLAVLRGRLEMLEEGVADGELSPDKLASACERLLSQVQRLEDYVNTMGNLQRIEERSVRPSAIPFSQLESNVKFLADTLGDAAGKTVTVCSEGNGGDSPLFLDESLVMEAIENLLSNALRYAHERVEVVIAPPRTDKRTKTIGSSSCDGKLTNRLYIQIRDDGPGFSPQALASACRPFYTEARDNGHLGVGLSIAAALCELHDGTLTLENAPEGGAIAIITFLQNANVE